TGDRRRFPGRARPARAAGALPAGSRRDRGDGDARPRRGAAPRQRRAGDEPPGVRLRPARRGADGAVSRAGVRPPGPRARDGAAVIEALGTMLDYGFMQRAFLGGAAVALMTGVLGVFVVQRGLAFLGDGLAHASF